MKQRPATTCSEAGDSCSLNPDALQDRIGEWTKVLRRATTAHRTPLELRFRLPRRQVDLVELEHLVAAERECCSFLTLDLSHDEHEISLRISGRPGSESMLDAFTGPS